jgi:hypothetical protein
MTLITISVIPYTSNFSISEMCMHVSVTGKGVCKITNIQVTSELYNTPYLATDIKRRI